MTQNDVGWDFVSVQREPTLAIKVYVLVVLASFIVAAVHLVKFWRSARILKRFDGNLDFDALLPLRDRALSLKRWIVLNILAWGVVAVYGVGNITKGIGSQKSIGAALLLDIFWDLCQPLILLQWAVLVLFLVRWHMLWRIERFEMGIISTQKT